MKNKLILSAAFVMSAFAATQAQSLPAYLPTDGLVGWWPFNGNANDESGNGNNGIVNGATLTADRLGNDGKAYSFDGVDDFIQMINSGPNGNRNITLSFWMKTVMAVEPGPIGGVGHIFGYGANDISQFGKSFTVTVNGSAASGNCAQSISFDSYGAVLAKTDVFNGEWNFYTIVNDTIAGNNVIFQKIYKNGVQMNTTCYFSPGVPTYPTNFSNITPIRLGKFYGDFCQNCQVQLPLFFAGSLDDIAIYNRALTQEEITALYTGEPVNPPTACNPLPANLQNGLLGYWPFCGNANDESGNGNDGMVNGATLTVDRFGNSATAYQFNGTNNIDLPNFNNDGDFSISIWFNPDSLYQLLCGQHVLISQLDNSQQFPNGYELGINELGQVGVGNGSIGTPYLNTYPINNWSHAICTYSASSSTIKLYIDGSLEGIRSPFIVNNIGTNFRIGQRPISSICGFEGSLDDIGIWNRALTADEVQQLYTLNACSFTIYDTVTVTQTVYDTVSVSVSTTDTLIINTLITAVQPAQENTFLVYPNPAGSQITINNGNVGILGGYTMRITNSAGQEVYNQNITQTELTLDLSTWGGNGLYILYINDPSNNTIAVKQIVLQ